MVKFYLADEKHMTIKGDVVELNGVLYFTQDKSGFEGKATKDHVKQYPGQFEEFVKAHPEYVLPASFSDATIGDAVSTAQVAPVAPVVEEPAKKSKKFF